MQGTSKVYSLDRELELPLGKAYLSASKYHNALVVIINQMGIVGSIVNSISTQLGDKLEGHGEEDIYDIKTLFGATESPFFEVLLRRLLQIVHSVSRIDPADPLMVSMFASLPVPVPVTSKEL
jgi:hypothetical protein